MANRKRILILSALCSTLLFSCGIKTIMQIYSSKVTINEYKNNDKEVHFIGMIHVGKIAFYKKVTEIIKEKKQEGAVLFYEYINFSKTDTITLRKTQKMLGFVPSPDNYAKLIANSLNDNTLKVQDNNQFLHLVNNKDFNVDYSAERIIKEYEKQFGEIKLNKEDLSLPIDSINKNKEPQKQAFEIILNHRNKYLAKRIENSPYKNIIVVYGKKHSKGLLEELKQLNHNWQKTGSYTR